MNSSSSGSIPNVPGLENDSPLSFRRMRSYLPGMEPFSALGSVDVPLVGGAEAGLVDAVAGLALGMEAHNAAGRQVGPSPKDTTPQPLPLPQPPTASLRMARR